MTINTGITVQASSTCVLPYICAGSPGPELASIPNVLAVAYGIGKSSSVLSVLRGKVVNGLVTHTSLARTLLEEAG